MNLNIKRTEKGDNPLAIKGKKERQKKPLEEQLVKKVTVNFTDDEYLQIQERAKTKHGLKVSLSVLIRAALKENGDLT
jgi:hypothetical protein